MAEAEVQLDDARVLVVANEQVGARMAGPAIRATNLADQLARRGARVTLAMPAEPDDATAVADGVEVAAFGTPSAKRFAELARASDVVVTQPQRVDVAWGLRRAGAPVVYDLYVPSFVERIAQLGTEPLTPGLRRRLLERDRMEYAAAVELGAAFVCASERQKDHWLGALGQAGRLDAGLIARDATADLLVGVVPFGLPQEAPAALEAGQGAIRGRLVPDDSVVLLWTGGLWNWFDPVLVVEALALARREDPRLRLVVMGVRHPESAQQEQEAARAMRRRAEELGLLADGGLVLHEGWVPYAERHRYLLDADIGVSAHHDSLETRLSFRTRLLDHLWAGLPTLTTAGGELSDRMVGRGAAVEVADGDVDAWVRELVRLAAEPQARAAMRVAAAELADDYRWQGTTEPLARIAAHLVPGGDGAAEGGTALASSPQRPRRLDAARYAALLVRVRAETKGLGSLGSAMRGAAGGDVER